MSLHAVSHAAGSPARQGVSAARPLLVPSENRLPFGLVSALFFLWGIPNNLNDILIRQFMKSFEMNRLEAGLVQSAFYLGYFLIAFPAGRLMTRVGYKKGILLGLFLYGAGCILFWPAALIARYWFFLFALFVIACGLSFLETASSPFIVQLGSSSNAEQRLNLAQSFNPLGCIAGILIGSRFIFSGVELNGAQVDAMRAAGIYASYLRGETLRVVVPYVVLGIVVLSWALLIARTHFPEIGGATESNPHAGILGPSLWRRPHFAGAVVAQFFYVGAQVGIWSYLISYVQTYTGLNERSAGYWLTGALAAFMLGRFVATLLLHFVSGAHLLAIYALLNTMTCLVAVLCPGWLGIDCLIVASFFMSMMFPTIFALGIRDLGLRTKTASSILVMSIIGGAVLTPLMGRLCDLGGLCVGYLVPVACFLGIALYAIFLSTPSRAPALSSTR